MNSDFFNTGAEALAQRFNAPGVEYRGKPFWSWNGELEEKELVRQAEIMKEMGLGGYFMHSRAGLITEYLGEKWFDCINAVSDCSKEIGMEAWLYDEDRWPSGSAGGMVTQNPKYRMKSMYVYEMKPEQFVWDDSVYSAFAAKIDGINIYEYFPIRRDADIKSLGGYKILKFAIVYDKPESVYNGTTYIDTMMLEAVEKFIELTHERYKEKCGERLGGVIKGIFTDEPHRGKMMGNYAVDEDGIISCAAAWTDDIFDEFRKRYGYDPEPILPELFYRKNGEILAPVKHDYIDLSDNLFIERFAMPINDWCVKNNIDFTGHILHEDSLMNQTVPSGSVMRFYQHMGVPGIDILSEGNKCYWAAKQLDSAARQTGKTWRLSELYGCTGWQTDFRAHKSVGVWQAFFGVNLRCHHLSWYTMEGESKRDYPASILHQAPWYKDYGYVETYFARLGVVMTEGKSVCDVLVLNPIDSVFAQAYLGWANWIFSASEDVNKLENHYADLFRMLSGRQVDFDYGEEQMMSQLASVEVEDGVTVLKVGEASYKTVVVSGMLTMRSTTLGLLKEFADMGGRIVFTEDIPEYVDVLCSDKVKELSNHKNSVVVQFSAEELAGAIKADSKYSVEIKDEKGNAAESVYCRIRECKEDNAIFAVFLNVDTENPVPGAQINLNGVSKADFSAVELWDCETGEKIDIKDGVVVNGDGSISFVLDFEKIDEKVVVFLAKASDDAVKKQALQVKEIIDITGEFNYILNELNICVLDYANWRFAGKEWHTVKEALKVDIEIRDTVGIERRGGEMLQPWFAKKYCEDEFGDIELEYEFYIDDIPESDIILCGERPENISYSINGNELVCPDYDDFWIDSCFKKLPVEKSFLRIGKNIVTARVNFKRTTNIEALFIIGDFGVNIVGTNERHIVKPASRVGFGNLCNYGLPFYSAEISYIIPNEKLPRINSGEKAYLAVPKFGGALIKVAKAYAPNETRLSAWEPYEIDITDFVSGEEDIIVTVTCSRRSTFGPLHLVPAILSAYGPNEFVSNGDNWSDEYVLLDSGIQDKISITVKE